MASQDYLAEMGTLFNNMGLYYMENANLLTEAMNYFEQAEQIRSKIAITSDTLKGDLCATLNNMGQVCASCVCQICLVFFAPKKVQASTGQISTSQTRMAQNTIFLLLHCLVKQHWTMSF